MPNYIMDTDHTSYILRGDPSVIEHAQQYDAAITIITVQELFNGWVSRANDPKQAARLIEIYAKLSTTVGYLKTVEGNTRFHTRCRFLLETTAQKSSHSSQKPFAKRSPYCRNCAVARCNASNW